MTVKEILFVDSKGRNAVAREVVGARNVGNFTIFEYRKRIVGMAEDCGIAYRCSPNGLSMKNAPVPADTEEEAMSETLSKLSVEIAMMEHLVERLKTFKNELSDILRKAK